MDLRPLAAVALAALLTACGSSDDIETPDPSTTEAEELTAAPGDPIEEEAAQDPLLGEAQGLGGDGTVTAVEYEQPVAEESPQPPDNHYPDDYVWSGLHVEVCIPTDLGDSDSAYVNRLPWSLIMDSGALLQPASSGYIGFPQPEYPWGDTMVRLGQCVSGWIVYAVPADDRPVGVQYSSPTFGNFYWNIQE